MVCTEWSRPERNDGVARGGPEDAGEVEERGNRSRTVDESPNVLRAVSNVHQPENGLKGCIIRSYAMNDGGLAVDDVFSELGLFAGLLPS